MLRPKEIPQRLRGVTKRLITRLVLTGLAASSVVSIACQPIPEGFPSGSNVLEDSGPILLGTLDMDLDRFSTADELAAGTDDFDEADTPNHPLDLDQDGCTDYAESSQDQCDGIVLLAPNLASSPRFALIMGDTGYYEELAKLDGGEELSNSLEFRAAADVPTRVTFLIRLLDIIDVGLPSGGRIVAIDVRSADLVGASLRRVQADPGRVELGPIERDDQGLLSFELTVDNNADRTDVAVACDLDVVGRRYVCDTTVEFLENGLVRKTAVIRRAE